MLVSWVVAVLFAPVIGVHILSANVKPHSAEPGRIGRAFNGGMLWAMRNRWWAIGITVALFAASVFSMQFVQNQFFPSSDRPEILVDLNLPQNASINETRKAVDRLEAIIKDDPDIERWSTYIGQGAIRFYLPLDQQLENPYYAQLVIVSKGLKARGELIARLQKRLREDFVGVGSFVQPLEMGPPVGRRSSTASPAKTLTRCASTPSNWRPCWTRTATWARSFTTGTNRAKSCASRLPRTRRGSWACLPKT